MAKRKTKAKRSLASLPKGLPSKNRTDVNLFEIAKSNHGGRKAKHDVNNRFTTTTTTTKNSLAKPSKLAESLQRRQSQQRAALQSSKKVNSFVDRRIGEFTMSQEDKMMARLVKERMGRSKRVSKYSLNDNDNDNQLTHRGKSIDQANIMNHVILDSDEEDGGNLDAMDTEMNFGGLDDGSGEINPYKPSGGQHNNMSQVYSQKKNDLDEMIKRRKIMKAERLMSKERQEETFESLDQGFDELAQLLQFRDKESDRKANLEKKKAGQGMQGDEKNTMDQEMQEWDREMKTYLFERKVKATDRTKTPEEIAKEEADRLHELETKRLARMNGDFEHDHLSDISDDEGEGRKKKRQKKQRSSAGAETLDDSDDDHEEEKLKVKFTADGLVYVDKDGKFVKKVGDENDEEHDDDGDGDEPTSDEEADSDASEDEDDDDHDDDVQKSDPGVILEVGARVKANYRANEQFDGQEAWHDGKIAQVHTDKAGNVTYDVDYDDGDYEDGVLPAHVRLVKLKTKEQEKEEKKKEEEIALKRKRQKAREKARVEIPFVFEVPTTLDALHDMIGNYASTGPEVSLIINRIHASNSVRLNKKNTEKMQNFYDVLLRRFVAVGDAIYASGKGGAELERYEQLNALTKTLFAMSSDAPESAAAVWGRRLGVFHNAHAKRLRDVELVQEEGEEAKSAWPSTGTILLLRALAHIFPVTDRRHQVVTPALILLCQIVAQTPVTSADDLVSGLMCAGLLIEYTRGAKRVVPEALAFLSGVLRIFAASSEAAYFPSMKELQGTDFRRAVSDYDSEDCPRISIEKSEIVKSTTPAAILCSALHLVDQCVNSLGGALDGAEPEAFAELADSLLALNPRSKTNAIPHAIGDKIAATASKLSAFLSTARVPLTRRSGPSRQEMSIKSLAPRLEDPDRYRMSKDQGKNANQAALDRSRREYKREHKAVARELRMDGAFAEQERRREQDKRDGKARAKRNKNFAWLEGEQGAMNQQVAQGGGLLSGGGMGAARAKAKSAKLGIKKGGKF